MRYPIRTLLRHPSNGKIYRIVWALPDRTWLMPIGAPPGQWAFSVSNNAIADDGYIKVSESDSGLPPRSADAKAWLHAERTQNRFKLNELTTPRLLTGGGRAELLHELSSGFPSKIKPTFYRVLRRWLEGGCVTEALLPLRKGTRPPISLKDLDQISFRSAVGQVVRQSRLLMSHPAPSINLSDHTVSGHPRLRRNVNVPTRYEVDRPTLRLFSSYFRAKHVAKGESLKATWERMRRRHFSSRSPTGGLVLWPLWVVPSYYQFEDWYYRITLHTERRRAAVGDHYFTLNERPIDGMRLTSQFGAGLVGSLDATIWNVGLVSSALGAKPIGPAIVFRIRCKDGGRLFGLAVTLESASWEGAASAIANCLEDKYKICTELGITGIQPEDFVQALPASIEADCGETDNHKPNRFIRKTGVRVTNLQYARPDLKGGVESDFNTLQCGLNGMTPSAIIKKHEETTGRPWKMKGTMTMEEFKKLLWLEELKRQNRPRPELILPEEMINSEVDTSPASMWDWMMKNKPTFIKTFALEDVRRSLLQTSSGTIEPRGLSFKGLIYSSEHITTEQRAVARRSGSVKVNVAFDSRVVDTVHIMVGDIDCPEQYLPCQLDMRWANQRSLAGKTFREVRDLRTASVRVNYAAAERSASRNAAFTEQQEQVIESSKQRTAHERKLLPASLAAMDKGIPTARRAEKDLTTPLQAMVPRIAADVAAPAAITEDQEPPATTRSANAAVPTPQRTSRHAARARAKSADTTEA